MGDLFHAFEAIGFNPVDTILILGIFYLLRKRFLLIERRTKILMVWYNKYVSEDERRDVGKIIMNDGGE